jgi:hypothetical protein
METTNTKDANKSTTDEEKVNGGNDDNVFESDSTMKNSEKGNIAEINNGKKNHIDQYDFIHYFAN